MSYTLDVFRKKVIRVKGMLTTGMALMVAGGSTVVASGTSNLEVEEISKQSIEVKVEFQID